MTRSPDSGDRPERTIEELRRGLAGAAPGERPGALAALAKALARCAMTSGAADPDAQARAEEAAALYEEAIAGADPTGRLPLRFELGCLLAARHLRISGAAADRDAAIAVFEECLAADGLAPWQTQTSGVWLGVLLMFRVLRLPVPVGADPPDLADLFPAMSGLEVTDPEDVRRAVAVLNRFAEAEDVEPELGRIAVGLRAVAVLFQVYNTADEDAVDLPRALALLDQAGDRIGEGNPGFREVFGLSAWLRADARAESDPQSPPDPGLVADLQRAVELEPGELLRSLLQMHLGVANAQSWLRSGDPEQLAAGPELMERTWERMRESEHPLYEDGLRRFAGLLLGTTAFQPSPEGVEKVLSLAQEVAARRDPGDRNGAAKDTYLLGMATLLRAALTGAQDDWSRASELLEEALAGIDDDDPLAVTMLSTYGATLMDRYTRRGGLEEAEAAQRYLARAERIHQSRREPGADEFEWRTTQGLLGAAAAQWAWRRGDAEALHRSVRDMRDAREALPATYPWRSRLDMELGRALLVQADLASRDLADKDVMDMAREGIALLESALDNPAIDTGNRHALISVGGLARVLDGVLRGDLALIDAGIAALDEAAATPETLHGQRAGALLALGCAHLVRAGTFEALRAAEPGEPDERDDAAEHRELGIARLEQAVGLLAAEPASPMIANALWELAGAYLARADAGDDALAVEAGLDALRARANDVLLQTGVEYGVATARGAAEMAQRIARWCLAERPEGAAGDRRDAVEALELGRGLVLHAATSATAVSDLLRAHGQDELAAEWGELGAVGAPPPFLPAVPGGRAGGGDPVAGLRHMEQAVTGPLMGAQTPGDLRQRVLDVLHRAGGVADLAAVPTVADVAGALAAAGVDLLVYLLAGDEAEPGLLLVVDAVGDVRQVPAPELRLDDARLGAYADRPPGAEHDGGWREALDAVGAWAWSAALGPLLADAREHGVTGVPRAVLVPGGMLGAVPWQAAHRPDGAGGRVYACQEFVLSYAASARQFVTAARRPRRGLLDDPVLVCDPTGALRTAAEQTAALRGAYYRDARSLGGTRREGDPAGTPDEVAAHIPGRAAPGASMLQVTCHGLTAGAPSESHLRLVGENGKPAVLRVVDLLRRSHGRPPDAPGGLVVLSACFSDVAVTDYDEALTLATAFQTTGAVAVVGSRWRVSGRLTPLLTFMFHRSLVRDGAAPVDALREAQLWMLDPHRRIPAEMPPAFANDARILDLADPAAWAAFTHQGV